MINDPMSSSELDLSSETSFGALLSLEPSIMSWIDGRRRRGTATAMRSRGQEASALMSQAIVVKLDAIGRGVYTAILVACEGHLGIVDFVSRGIDGSSSVVDSTGVAAIRRTAVEGIARSIECRRRMSELGVVREWVLSDQTRDRSVSLTVDRSQTRYDPSPARPLCSRILSLSATHLCSWRISISLVSTISSIVVPLSTISTTGRRRRRRHLFGSILTMTARLTGISSSLLLAVRAIVVWVCVVPTHAANAMLEGVKREGGS